MYRTGDYASFQSDGSVHYEGRTDSQIKIRGHRVDLSEIEKHLLSIDGIDKGIVLCYHTGQIDQAILAFAAVESKSTLHEMQIENLLRQKLPDYMTPQVVVVESLPLLVNGKIDRQSLLKTYENVNNNGKQKKGISAEVIVICLQMIRKSLSIMTSRIFSLKTWPQRELCSRRSEK